MKRKGEGTKKKRGRAGKGRRETKRGGGERGKE